MFTKLKQHWKVNGLDLILIIITFAVGGSLCGIAGRKIMTLLNIEKGALWILLYILLVTLLWPMAVLLVSIPLGQFVFFKNYIGKIVGRFSNKKNHPIINVAIFASGAGSNAHKIINYFAGHQKIKIALIICNKPGAGVLNIAAAAGIPSLIIERADFFNGDNYLPRLQKHQISFIVLAGFLWKIPPALIKAFPKKIINIHPALLPQYGGKGMFGYHVHEAVIANKETVSGISIHYVDELYDHGALIFQATCTIDENETAPSLAKKIHVLEHEHYPKVIEQVLQKVKSPLKEGLAE